MRNILKYAGLWVAACALTGGVPAYAQQPESARLVQMLRGAGIDQGGVDHGAGNSDRFWKDVARAGTPLIEKSGTGGDKILVTFLWREADAGANVRVYGDFIGKEDRAGAPLERIGGTDIWHRSFIIGDAARFRYYLTAPQRAKPNPAAVFSAELDGVVYEAFRDPLNARTIAIQDLREVDAVSYAEGPRAVSEPYLKQRAGVARGRVETFEISSDRLGNRRKISVYTPAGYAAGGAKYPLLVLLDGREYQVSVPTPTLLDNMAADGVIAPMVAVLVDNIDDETRTREFPPRSDLFDHFLTEELLPWVRARYAVTSDPAATVIAGSSFGGLAALNAAIAHPDAFGNVLALSGAFGWAPGDPRERGEPPLLSAECCLLLHRVADAPRRAIKVDLGVGTWEETDILLTNRLMRDLLRAKGYAVTYREYEGGHDYVNWRSELPQGLIALFGGQKGVRP